MKELYPEYLWLGIANERGQVVVATDRQPSVVTTVLNPGFSRCCTEGRSMLVTSNHSPSWEEGRRRTYRADERIPRRISGGHYDTCLNDQLVPNVIQTLLAYQQREGLQEGGHEFLTKSGVAFVQSELQFKGNVNLKQPGLSPALLAEQSSSGMWKRLIHIAMFQYHWV